MDDLNRTPVASVAAARYYWVIEDKKLFGSCISDKSKLSNIYITILRDSLGF